MLFPCWRLYIINKVKRMIDFFKTMLVSLNVIGRCSQVNYRKKIGQRLAVYIKAINNNYKILHLYLY